MKDFFVPKDLLLFSNNMGMNSDFSVRGFSGGLSEAMATLTATVSALWTPAEITTALWLDASDTETITLDGSAVSEWRDKSCNVRHAAQSTLASKPARIANGVQFDGVNDYLGFASAIIQNTATLLMVITPTIEATVGFCFGQWASGVNGRLGLAANQNCSGVTQSGMLNPFIAPATSGGCSNGYPSHFSISSVPTIVGITVSVPGSENWKSYKNGVMQDSATASYVATGVNSSLGSANAGITTYPYDGIIREVIALHAISDTDRQKIEGYLAHKWDELLGVSTLVDALPSDHPYKSSTPMI